MVNYEWATTPHPPHCCRSQQLGALKYWFSGRGKKSILWLFIVVFFLYSFCAIGRMYWMLFTFGGGEGLGRFAGIHRPPPKHLFKLTVTKWWNQFFQPFFIKNNNNIQRKIKKKNTNKEFRPETDRYIFRISLSTLPSLIFHGAGFLRFLYI